MKAVRLRRVLPLDELVDEAPDGSVGPGAPPPSLMLSTSHEFASVISWLDSSMSDWSSSEAAIHL